MHPQGYSSKPISSVGELVEDFIGRIMSAGEEEAARCTNEGGTPPQQESQ